MKVSKWIISILFLVYLLLMSASLFFKKPEFSEVENRYLNEWPKVSKERVMNGKFMDGVEKYISDHVMLRDRLVQLKAGVERLTGKPGNEGIAFGKDGSLIELLSGLDESTGFRNVNEINQFTEAMAVPVYFGLIPTAASVWADKLPAGAPTMDEEAEIRAFYEASRCETVDVSIELKKHKNEYIFYRTDHHWTTRGAYYGGNAVLSALKLQPIAENELTIREVSDSFYGTNYSKAGVFWAKPDTVETFVDGDGLSITSWFDVQPEKSTLYHDEYLDKKDKYSYFLGGNMGLCIIKTGTPGPKLLLLRDSYSSSMLPLLTKRFSEIHVMDMRYCRMDVQGYAKSAGVDAVVILYGIKTFLNDSNLVFLN